MRKHERGSAKEAFYTPEKWRELINEMEATLTACATYTGGRA